MSERLSPTIIMLPPATPTKHTLTLTIIRLHLHEYIHQGRTSSSTHVCSCVRYILNNFILKQSAKFIRRKAGVAKPTLWWTYVIITSLTWIGVNIADPVSRRCKNVANRCTSPLLDRAHAARANDLAHAARANGHTHYV